MRRLAVFGLLTVIAGCSGGLSDGNTGGSGGGGGGSGGGGSGGSGSATNPLTPDSKVEIKKADIKERKPAKLSPMPDGLLNTLSKDEVLDLLAYIESVGKAKATNFKK